MAGLSLSTSGVSSSKYVAETHTLIYKADDKFKAGLTIGAELGYMPTSWLQTSIGLLYSQQGSKINYTEDGEVAKLNFKQDYIIIPVLAHFYVWDGLALKAGVQPGLRVKSKMEDIDVKDATRSVQLQIPVGISYEHSNVQVDARMMIPVTKTFKKDKVADAYKDAMNCTFMFTVGYNFVL